MRSTLIIAAIWVVYVASACTMLRGGADQVWTSILIPHYLDSSQSLPAKIFDLRVTEAFVDGHECYQARELAYLNEWIDSLWIDFSVRHGFANLMSISAIVFTLAMMLLIRAGLVNIGYSESTAIMAVSLLASCPQLLLTPYCMRTGKWDVALCLCAVFWILTRKRISLVGLFIISLCACLFDRQGFFFVCIGSIALLALNWRAAVSVACAAGISTIYNWYICPAIIFHYHGYYPDFSYQQLPWRDLRLTHFAAGLDLVENLAGTLFGGFWRIDFQLAVLVALGFIAWFKDRKQTGLLITDGNANVNVSGRPLLGKKVFMLYAGSLVALSVMYALMYLRADWVILPESKNGIYYFIPGIVILLVITAMACRNVNQTILHTAMLLALFGNLYFAPTRLKMIQDAPTGFYQFVPDLLKALNQLPHGIESTDPVITENSIYQFFDHRFVPKS